jgi:hypothetical protein
MKLLTLILLFLSATVYADEPANSDQTQLYTALIQQSSNPAGNSVYLISAGDNNTVTISQDTMSVNGTYQHVEITGDNNTVTQTQYNNSSDSASYIFSNITGNNNTVSISQDGTGTKGVFDVIVGNNNSLNATQSGAGNHLLEATLLGSNNILDIAQLGDITNHATISLTNAGGANSLIVTQSGGQTFNFQQTCATPAGCPAIVTQK